MRENEKVSLGFILSCGGACSILCENLCGFCYSRAKQTTKTKCTLILHLPVLVYMLKRELCPRYDVDDVSLSVTYLMCIVLLEINVFVNKYSVSSPCNRFGVLLLKTEHSCFLRISSAATVSSGCLVE